MVLYQVQVQGPGPKAKVPRSQVPRSQGPSPKVQVQGPGPRWSRSRAPAPVFGPGPGSRSLVPARPFRGAGGNKGAFRSGFNQGANQKKVIPAVVGARDPKRTFYLLNTTPQQWGPKKAGGGATTGFVVYSFSPGESPSFCAPPICAGVFPPKGTGGPPLG